MTGTATIKIEWTDCRNKDQVGDQDERDEILQQQWLGHGSPDESEKRAAFNDRIYSAFDRRVPAIDCRKGISTAGRSKPGGGCLSDVRAKKQDPEDAGDNRKC
jgi:hypothetical protein